jgi:outer membrane receptor protein involved in Fe transport
MPFSWEGFGTPGPPAPTKFDQTAVGLLAVPNEIQVLKNFLGKVRYDFSRSTYAVATFETTTDFDDYSALAGSMGGLLLNGVKHYRDPLGHTYILSYPGVFTQDLRPKYALELHTQLLGGSLVVRSYDHHLLNIFDATKVPAEVCCFWDTTRDHIAGQALTWTKLLGKHAVTLGYSGDADSYHYAYLYGGPAYGQYASLYNQAATYEDLERQTLLRDDYEASQKLDLTLALFHSYTTGLYIRRTDPRFGIVYRPKSSDVIRFSYGTGFSIPPIADYASPILTTVAYGASLGFAGCPASEPSCVASGGNSRLREETAQGFDVSFQRQFPNNGLFAIDLYRTNLQGHLVFGFEPAPPGLTFGPNCLPADGGTCAGQPVLYLATTVNLAAFVYRGIEAEARIPFGSHFNIDTRFNVQSAYPRGVDPFIENINQYIVNNQQFLEVPLHKPSASLNYSNNSTSAFIRWSFYDQWNEFFRPPFSEYDAGAQVAVGPAYSLQITESNIFNANYVYPPFYSYYNPAFSTFGSVFTYGIDTVNYPGYSGPYYYPANNSAPHVLTISLETKWGAMRSH